MRFFSLGKALTIFIVASLSLSACGLNPGSLSDGTVADLDTRAAIITPRRWRFAASKQEIKQKNQSIKNIDHFWQKFQTDVEHPTAPKEADQTKDLVDDTRHELAVINPQLACEFNTSPGGDRQLNITVDSRDELRPVVDTMLERAPKIAGWTFSGYRQAVPFSDVKVVYAAITKHPLPQFAAVCRANSGNIIDITISAPAFNGYDNPQDKADAIVLCTILLGEENLEKWAGTIGTMQSAPAAETAHPARDVGTEARNLIDSFSREKEKIEQRLPDRPYFQLPEPGADKYVVFMAKEQDAPKIRRSSTRTWLPLLVEGLGLRKNFCSENYSKVGEKFCFLEVRNLPGVEDPKKREALENSFDKFLRQAKLGCTLGSGRGSEESLFIDMAIVDVDKVIDVLRSACNELHLPRSSWLRFYDTTWRHEWVGMYDNTNEPDNPFHGP